MQPKHDLNFFKIKPRNHSQACHQLHIHIQHTERWKWSEMMIMNWNDNHELKWQSKVSFRFEPCRDPDNRRHFPTILFGWDLVGRGSRAGELCAQWLSKMSLGPPILKPFLWSLWCLKWTWLDGLQVGWGNRYHILELGKKSYHPFATGCVHRFNATHKKT